VFLVVLARPTTTRAARLIIRSKFRH